MVLTQDTIRKGDTIYSTRFNKSYQVIGYSLEYYIVDNNGKLKAVKKTDAVKI